MSLSKLETGFQSSSLAREPTYLTSMLLLLSTLDLAPTSPSGSFINSSLILSLPLTPFSSPTQFS